MHIYKELAGESKMKKIFKESNNVFKGTSILIHESLLNINVLCYDDIN